MRAEELTVEFGIAGILDFVETEHGLVKAMDRPRTAGIRNPAHEKE
jgi:hypothetical protein